MADVFTPQEQIREVKYWTGRRLRDKHYPDAGNRVGVYYMEVASGNLPAVAALLNQIKALAVVDPYTAEPRWKQLSWIAAANAGKDPKVDVSVTVDMNSAKPAPVEPGPEPDPEVTFLVAACNDAATFIVFDDGENLVTSPDFKTGTGSIQWDKPADGYDGRTRVVSYPILGTPPSIDISGAEPDERVALTFKLPTVAGLQSIKIDIGTYYAMYDQWEWPADGIVAGAWVTLYAKISEPTHVEGPPTDLARIEMIKFCATYAGNPAIQGFQLDRVAIVAA